MPMPTPLRRDLWRSLPISAALCALVVAGWLAAGFAGVNLPVTPPFTRANDDTMTIDAARAQRAQRARTTPPLIASVHINKPSAGPTRTPGTGSAGSAAAHARQHDGTGTRGRAGTGTHHSSGQSTPAGAQTPAATSAPAATGAPTSQDQAAAGAQNPPSGETPGASAPTTDPDTGASEGPGTDEPARTATSLNVVSLASSPGVTSLRVQLLGRDGKPIPGTPEYLELALRPAVLAALRDAAAGTRPAVRLLLDLVAGKDGSYKLRVRVAPADVTPDRPTVADGGPGTGASNVIALTLPVRRKPASEPATPNPNAELLLDLADTDAQNVTVTQPGAGTSVSVSVEMSTGPITPGGPAPSPTPTPTPTPTPVPPVIVSPPLGQPNPNLPGQTPASPALTPTPPAAEPTPEPSTGDQTPVAEPAPSPTPAEPRDGEQPTVAAPADPVVDAPAPETGADTDAPDAPAVGDSPERGSAVEPGAGVPDAGQVSNQETITSS